MGTGTSSASQAHPWRFHRVGGFDQVVLDRGSDIACLDQLDQKLWVALACPTGDIHFDPKTLALIDADNDGRIRPPEILAAAKWVCGVLRDADVVAKPGAELPLAAINADLPEGAALLASAKRILADLGKPEATAIRLDDVLDTARIFANTTFNGDGIIPVAATDDVALQAAITNIMACVGSETDRCGAPGVSQAKVDAFFAAAQAYVDWCRQGEENAAAILPLGDSTAAAAAALAAVRAKIDDYFTRCRLVAFDGRAAGAMNRGEAEYAAMAASELSADGHETAALPIALVAADRPLPLDSGLNPAWTAAVATLRNAVIVPLLGEHDDLTAEEWATLKGRFAPYEAWNATKGAGAAVAALGTPRVQELLGGTSRQAIVALIAKDKALEPEANAIASVEKLLRLQRDFAALLRNTVTFADFYGRKKAVFQVGTLFLDGRSCDLCIKVVNPAPHATLAPMSMMHLAYCNCVRRGSTDKMSIAAAFTGGDSDYLVVGRNGVFYDRQGQDWDATITKIVENPISVRQAFWKPYKRFARFVGEQINKFAASREKAVEAKSEGGAAAAAQKLDAAKGAPTPAFDIARFAGIFAAIVTGLLKMPLWQLPLVVLGIILVISGPAMLLAWMKLRQRNLGPLLDASGWAINARARINIPFGASLTGVARLPAGAERSLRDPYADQPSPWPKVILLAIILLSCLHILNQTGKLYDWFGVGKQIEVVDGTIPDVAPPPPPAPQP